MYHIRPKTAALNDDHYLYEHNDFKANYTRGKQNIRYICLNVSLNIQNNKLIIFIFIRIQWNTTTQDS